MDLADIPDIAWDRSIRPTIDWDFLREEGIKMLADPSQIWDKSRQSRALWYQKYRTVRLPRTKGKTRWTVRRDLREDHLIVVSCQGYAYNLAKLLKDKRQILTYDRRQLPRIVTLEDLTEIQFRYDYKEIILLNAHDLFNRRDPKWIYKRTQDACRPDTVYLQLGINTEVPQSDDLVYTHLEEFS